MAPKVGEKGVAQAREPPRTPLMTLCDLNIYTILLILFSLFANIVLRAEKSGCRMKMSDSYTYVLVQVAYLVIGFIQ